MPKGVEHIKSVDGRRFTQTVTNPLMPKGVEHKTTNAANQVHYDVTNPLMPKGVEHSADIAKYLSPARDKSFDAERR